MALIEYRATTIPRAFFLNALSLGLSIALSAFAADLIDPSMHGRRLLLQVLVSSVSLYATFWVLRLLFGYGGGMLAAPLPA